MAVYKTKFCKIGYNPRITTSSDPEDVCTKLGLNGSGVYVFPTPVPSPLENSSVYTRQYFICSSSILDTGYHDLEDGILIDENTHGSVGAIEVKTSGLNTSFGITEEVIRLNGQTPVELVNHYHRINDVKVVTMGRLLSNQGDIYISALDAARGYTLVKLSDYVSSGVPIATQNTYAQIPAGDGRMISSHYTVPRAHSLYIESIRIDQSVIGSNFVTWKLMAGVNGALHSIYKGSSQSSGTTTNNPILTFKDGYLFPAGTDLLIRINTIAQTTDISSIMEGYLVSQVKLELENEFRKAQGVLISREDEITNQAFVESEYNDEEFSDVPVYGGVLKEERREEEARIEEERAVPKGPAPAAEGELPAP